MKIVFITYHNWESKRHGGFHQFAKYAASAGHQVVFFSFARPYYIYFKHDERMNKSVLNKLRKGMKYLIGDGELLNITWPTLGLPGFIRHFFPYKVNEWLMTHSFTSFNRFSRKYLSNTDCFIFESADPVLLVNLIRRNYPKATLIYRPSDPLWERSNDFFNVEGEKQMLKIADKIVAVNKEAINGYMKVFPDTFNINKSFVLSNGVDLRAFRSSYPKPKLLQGKKSACYIGAFKPDFELMIKTALEIPEATFVLISPHEIDYELNERINSINNLVFIPGISPNEVPKWITNCTVVIQPFPKSLGYALKTSVNLTAQNYKAMAARKPIIAYQIPMYLSKYGIVTTDTPDSFIQEVKKALYNEKETHYDNVNLNELDWNRLCKKFIEICKK